MPTASFDQSVFVNCPFDDEFAPVLQAVAFCITYLGFHPRLAPENSDNAAPRLDRIIELVKGSKYGIHDLSRCRATEIGEYSRLNMSFELGVDYSCRKFGAGRLAEKVILVLEHERYDYQKTLSDIAGWDIHDHGGNPDQAVRHVRSWLVHQATIENVGAARILGKYLAFQGWYYEQALAAGSSEDDIRAYPTAEIVKAMREWMDSGQPG